MSKFFREGEVISVEGDKCEIQLSLSGFCSGEHKCAITAFTEGMPPDRNRIRARNSIGARVGEKVMIEVLSPGFYKSLFFVFLLPLIAIFLGCALGIKAAVWMDMPQRSNLYTGICGVFFFCLSLFVSRFVNQRVSPRYILYSRMDESSNCENCSLMLKQ